jgi:ABC-type proline/glycine betaine transport system ATPase subunit
VCCGTEDCVLIDKALVDVPRSKVREQLLEVGFDDERQAEIVGGLSGGWKMKLELARAMLYNADLLLLDEVSVFPLIHTFTDSQYSFQPTNHVSHCRFKVDKCNI